MDGIDHPLATSPVSVEIVPPGDTDEATRLHRAIIGLKREVGRCLLDLGYCLLTMHDTQGWATLGYDSWQAYLGDPEVSFRRSHAYRIMGIYRTFGVKLALPKPDLDALADIDLHKLDMIRPFVTPENWREWTEDARVLSRTDLLVKVQTARGNGNAEPPPPDQYAVEDRMLSDLAEEIVLAVRFTGKKLEIDFDGGRTLRVWTDTELRVLVS